MNPRPEFGLSGYQQAPLEMCYLAIDAVAKGDFYYLNLLTDVPTAGILDLKDFTKKDAIEWATSWRELLTGNDALKIPILYEHEEEVKWIPFGPPPEGVMLNESLARYTRLIHACFGLYTQDTGLGEREITRTGQGAVLERRAWHKFSALIALWETFWNSILPDDLEFKHEVTNIDETERLARAAVATANALGIYARAGILGKREIRREIAESGFLTSYINTEEIPEDTIMGGFGGGIQPVIAGQSRWTEQRLPTEGRRQALPAPKTAQREEWHDRVRPKALTTDLTSILIGAFEKIVDVPEEALKQIIHDASIVLAPPLQEAKSFTDSFDRWLDEFLLLMAGEESLLKSKALVRKQRRTRDVIEN